MEHSPWNTPNSRYEAGIVYVRKPKSTNSILIDKVQHHES